MKSELYCDGGVIGKNPSPYGGTWAFCLVEDGEIVACDSGIVHPHQVNSNTVSNNQTEMMAVLMGLDALPDDWIGTVYSDSQVTLGRIFKAWSLNNIPAFMKRKMFDSRRRLVNWSKIESVLLAGHPTKKQLETGIGRNGLPVSKHNVWCDQACTALSQVHLEAIRE